LRQPSGEFWRAVPRRFRALQKRHMRERAERLADAANLQGAKVTPEDFMPKRAGAGPEVYQAIAADYEELHGER
jgi:hypothetical protein